MSNEYFEDEGENVTLCPNCQDDYLSPEGDCIFCGYPDLMDEEKE